jgi:hypothetical protein
VSGLVLAVLVGVGMLLDHPARVRDSVAVDGCARDATSSTRYAIGRVDAIDGYVRPVLDGWATPPVRKEVLRIVSRAVAPTVPDVRRARAGCAGIHVLWLHHGLRSRQRECLAMLDRDLGYLDAVTADGSRAFTSRSLPVGRCR